MPGAQGRRATTKGDVEYLAATLLDTERTRPVAVISMPFASDGPWIDAEDILTNVGDLVDVWVLTDKRSSWQFADLLPPETQVYGGAGRVYPVGDAWQVNPYISPLRLVARQADGARAPELLISDALNMAVDAGLLSRTATSAAKPIRHDGVVIGAVGTRALVTLDNGHHAAIWRELTVPGVELEELVGHGQRVSGVFDPATGRLDVRESILEPDEALRDYAVGDVVVARVEDVGTDWVTLIPFPGRTVRLAASAITDDETEDL